MDSLVTNQLYHDVHALEETIDMILWYYRNPYSEHRFISLNLSFNFIGNAKEV